MIHFLNAYTVGASLDRLEAGLLAAFADGELTAGSIHTLVDGARARLELTQGMIAPEDSDVESIVVESFDEADPDPERGLARRPEGVEARGRDRGRLLFPAPDRPLRD